VSTTTKVILGVVAALALVAGVVAFSVLRPPAEASRPIEAVPIAADTAAPAAQPTAAPAAPEPTAAPAQPTAAPEATAAPTQPVAATAPATAAPAQPTTAAAERVFSIVPEESEVRFIIDEVLNNAPFTVVGTTDQVAGQIAVDPQDPAKSRVGVIQVNARTLATDSQFRDRALKNRILTTDQYEFITFEPTALNGLPPSGQVGQSYSFQMTGNLTIRDVTREVTFDVTVTPMSDSRLEGTATTTVLYPDFGLTIPRVPSVASVEDEVRLELDFVAVS
jgi:polyisoprenoid-binding protein YceI